MRHNVQQTKAPGRRVLFGVVQKDPAEEPAAQGGDRAGLAAVKLQQLGQVLKPLLLGDMPAGYTITHSVGAHTEYHRHRVM